MKEKTREKVERIRQAQGQVSGLIHSRVTRWVVFVVVPVMLFAVSFLTGFLFDVGKAATQRVSISVPGYMFYDGVVSLDETIVSSDVIALVTLKSVDRGVDIWKRLDDVTYSKTLEFNFQVIEYLKGDGGDEVTGLVFDSDSQYNTALGARLGQDVDPSRNTHWDKREAVVFLREENKDSRVNWKKDRYWLSTASKREGEEYSITNRYYRPWLPATRDNNRVFLLEHDQGRHPQKTVTLEDLKIRIAQIDQELAGRSEAYRDCVLYGYEWQRNVDYTKETLADGEEYPYRATHVDISSGIAAGTKIYTSDLASIAAHGETLAPPGTRSRYVLAGQHAEYFTGAMPGEIFLDRPLPEGKYRTFHSYHPFEAYLCNAPIPKEDMERSELFINVTAPHGTVYEAYFDPVQDGTALGAAFTGEDALVERVMWKPVSGEAGTVTASTDDLKGLAGHTLAFIALDGSVRLSLDADKAKAASGTLSWDLKKQPWQSGDKLMLRVSAPAS